jgi:hypothetical protein
MLCRSCNLLSACFLLPDVESAGSDCATGTSGQQMAARVEVAINECMSGNEVLTPFRRFESLHLTLSPACQPV